MNNKKVKVLYKVVGGEEKTIVLDNKGTAIQRYLHHEISEDTFLDILEKAIQYLLAKDEDDFVNIETLEFEVIQ